MQVTLVYGERSVHKWPEGIGSRHREDHHRDALILSPDRTTLEVLFKGLCKLLARKCLCSLNSFPGVSNTIMTANS